MKEEQKSQDDENHFFDLIIQEIGGFGRFQKFLLFLSSISSVIAACNHLSPIYLTYTPCFECSTNDNFTGFQCNTTGNQCMSDEDYKCGKWNYDKGVFKSTVVTDFNLVCDQAQLLPTIASSYMIGIVITAIFMGLISDRFGRKTIIIWMSLVHILASFLTSFSTTYPMFVGTRFFVGGSIHAVWSAYFVLMLELIPASNRSFCGGFMNFTWNIGSLLMTLCAYFIRSWNNLQLTFAGFSCALLSYFILLPESPRWDLYAGNTEKAKNTFLKIAKTNGIDISQTNFQRYFDVLKDQTIKSIEEKKQRDVIQEVKNVGKNGEFMKRLILLIPPWFCIGMGSYGIHFSVDSVDFDIFATTAIKDVISFTFILILIPVFKRVNRTTCLITFYFIGGLFGIAFILIPERFELARVVVYMLAQGLMIGNFFMLDTYTPDVFSTDVRNVTFSLLDGFSKVGTAIAPFIVYLKTVTNLRGLPPAIFGSLMIFSSIFLCFMPETKNITLVQTIDELKYSGNPSISQRVRNKWKKK